MKKTLPISMEFIYQFFSLIVIVIVVHAAYVGIIRPNADAILARQAAMMEKNNTQSTERSIYVLIRDYEQEACFILMFWALAIMAFKAVNTTRNRTLLQRDLIPLAEGVRILPEDTRELSREIQGLPTYQPAMFRMSRMPPMHIARPRANGWNPSCL
jgi:hypothetical protein